MIKTYDLEPMKFAMPISMSFARAANGSWKCPSVPDDIVVTEMMMNLGNPSQPELIFDVVPKKPGKYALEFQQVDAASGQHIETCVYNIEWTL